VCVWIEPDRGLPFNAHRLSPSFLAKGAA
jgi:hypothetical protein